SGRQCCAPQAGGTPSPARPKSPTPNADMPENAAPRGEVAAMVAVQSALAGRPGLLTIARGMSHFGEHSVGWVAVALIGAVLDPRRRRDWLVGGAGGVGAPP